MRASASASSFCRASSRSNSRWRASRRAAFSVSSCCWDRRGPYSQAPSDLTPSDREFRSQAEWAAIRCHTYQWAGLNGVAPVGRALSRYEPPRVQPICRPISSVEATHSRTRRKQLSCRYGASSPTQGDLNGLRKTSNGTLRHAHAPMRQNNGILGSIKRSAALSPISRSGRSLASTPFPADQLRLSGAD